MNANRLFVIGASAGGVETLKLLVSLLPEDFPASIAIVLHVSPHGKSFLPDILTRAGKLRAIHPEDSQPPVNGRIYIAPPDKHLLVKPDLLIVTNGPRENGHRPAIDPLFRSAAQVYSHRVVGIILSGTLDDGTAGLAAIKKRSGIAIVQDPGEALYAGMPESALENVAVDYVLPVVEIAALMVRLAGEKVEQPSLPISEDIEYENDIAELNMNAIENELPSGEISMYVCPECGGTLWEISDGGVLRYRCHVGHAYSAETMLAEQSSKLEAALWVALRVLEDNARLTRRMAERARKSERYLAARQFELQLHNIEANAQVIRDILLKGEPVEGKTGEHID